MRLIVDEAARLKALADYEVLDTPAEAEFDEIAFIASRACNTPVGLVSLVTHDRQWFKARVGVDLCETPIEQSVCAHGLASSDPLIIPDLTLDPRTRNNTLVTEGPEIRFYAGAPLMTPEQQVVGMLCVIDTVPRPEGLTEDQVTILTYLANQAMRHLELRKALRVTGDDLGREQRAGAAHLRRTNQVQAAGGFGTFELDVALDRLSVSPEMCRIFGLPVAPSYESSTFEALAELPDGRSSPLSRADGSAELTVEYRIRRADTGELRWIERRAEFVRDPQGQVTTMIGVVQDVTPQRQVNEEIGHRLKNTLSLVQAISAHSLRAVPDREPVQEFDRRLHALSTAHDMLMQRSRAAAPLRQVAHQAAENLGIANRILLDGPLVELNEQTTLHFSMLVHEMATNAMKYGALSVATGLVTLSWRIEGDAGAQALVIDWVERGGPPARTPEHQGLGSRLIARGIGAGPVTLDYAEAGFSAELRAPLAGITG